MDSQYGPEHQGDLHPLKGCSVCLVPQMKPQVMDLLQLICYKHNVCGWNLIKVLKMLQLPRHTKPGWRLAQLGATLSKQSPEVDLQDQGGDFKIWATKVVPRHSVSTYTLTSEEWGEGKC